MDIDKIAALAELMHRQILEDYRRTHGTRNPELADDVAVVTVKEGKKYTKLDVGGVGRSGKLMVENETGIIYGIKGYGKVNKHYLHTFGTLDTINEWYWGAYKPSKVNK